MVEASAAGFSAFVYKDHFYPGIAHTKLLEMMLPPIPLSVLDETPSA
ncbi:MULTISPECIES: hypothetical protein [unclassified Neorhizobium]|nr:MULTISPECIES: hypothetical protein [unclassified Neorhizobium]MCJ9672521.1 hypothetical protein [Neorhizobium sp. SHOUNA12B]MCJ9746973.1 hypothetical protein [Neorhizobium sp. SHOUNA12A]